MPDVENVMEKEVETVPQMDSSPETQEIARSPEPEGSAPGRITNNIRTLQKISKTHPQMVVL